MDLSLEDSIYQEINGLALSDQTQGSTELVMKCMAI